ncbi:MAG: hypothetical protein HC794_03455 [Nitrospiraceae bacterium]|nr:hypothetical protein [Nitrospiraceae bacterium]
MRHSRTIRRAARGISSAAKAASASIPLATSAVWGDLDLNATANLDGFDWRLHAVHEVGDVYDSPQHHWVAGLQGRVECLEAAGLDHRRLKAAAPYDLVFANILKGPLIELAPTIAAHLATNGRAILSGLLVQQAEAVSAAYVAAGLCLQDRDDLGEWSVLVLQKC